MASFFERFGLGKKGQASAPSQEKPAPSAPQGDESTRESQEWEKKEWSAFVRQMNNVAESLHMAFIGGPEGIDQRFQTLDLTDEDLGFLAQTLTEEDGRYLTFLRKFMESIDLKIKENPNPFYKEKFGPKVRVANRLINIVSGAGASGLGGKVK